MIISMRCMKMLLLWTAFIILAGYAYVSWTTPAEPTAEVADVVVPPPPPPPPVPFLIKSKTRQVFDEWKAMASARSAGDQQVRWMRIHLCLEAIRQRLHRDGAFAPDALEEAMAAAAREIGYDEQSARHIVEAVMQGAAGGVGEAPGLSGANP
jgi:hypothetical protein